jgi:hypothetical protein
MVLDAEILHRQGSVYVNFKLMASCKVRTSTMILLYLFFEQDAECGHVDNKSDKTEGKNADAFNVKLGPSHNDFPGLVLLALLNAPNGHGRHGLVGHV